MGDDYESWISDAISKDPVKRTDLEQQAVKQEVGGRSDAARALYEGINATKHKGGGRVKGGRSKKRLDKRGR